jgi:hypothetical protein
LASKTPSRFVEPVRGLGRLSTQKKPPASVMRRIIFGGEGGIFCRKMDKVVLFQWVNFYIPLFITYIRESLTC